ncbi:MAG: hypothetical protein DHS20C21_10850 [Gemmatimonadota bacterium]|nr:MAG: hypothetical protein DHS20C21_10850 [Gemmatimonadota bacterium]
MTAPLPPVLRALGLLAPALTLLLAGAPAHAQDPANPRVYTTQRTSTPPRIDGILDDSVWDQVEWGADFLTREPSEGDPPTGETFFKILYDDANLYVAYRANDPEPDQVASILGRRDNFPGGWVEINIDSYDDNRTAFSFTISASGTQGDEFISEDGDNWDGNWDPIWESRTRLDAQGWTAEVRIPLSQLRYADKEEHVWGIQVQRRVYREEERSAWQPIPKDVNGWVSQFGELRGIRGIKAQRQIEILPYTLAQGERFEKVDGDPFADGASGKLSGGVDGKIGVTGDLTLDFSINPDFGQVEADPSEVNLTAFESFFAERRPFFVEGANIFSSRIAPSVAFGTHTQDRMFYSRRIGRSPQYRADRFEDGYVDQPGNTSILGAMKLTGKTRRGLSIGILESVTARERAEVADDTGGRRDVTVEPATNYFVGRLQKDYRDGETRIGGLVTSVNRNIQDTEVEFLHESAYSGGVDFYHSIMNRSYYTAINVVGSRVAGSEEAILRTQRAPARYYQRPDNKGQSVDPTRTSLSGHAGSVRVGKSGGKVQFDTGAAWRSPGFEINDIGFLRNTDEINQFSWVGYSLRNPFSVFRRMSFNVNQWLDYEYAGGNTYQAFNFNTNANFLNNWNYNASATRENERISNSELRGGPAIKIPGDTNADFGINSDGRRSVSGGFGAGLGRTDDNAGKSSNFWTYVNWRPSNAVFMELNPGYSHREPEFQFVDAVDNAGEDAYLYGALDQKTFDLSFRLDYSVSPTLTIQYYGAPFVSAGRYSDFKRVTDPRATEYADRFRPLDGDLAYDAGTDTYLVDESGDTVTDYEFRDPDFNVRDFNSNLVVRWQYSPGSSIFLVWSQSRFGFEPRGDFDLKNDIDSLFEVHPENVFLIKMNRWFNL